MGAQKALILGVFVLTLCGAPALACNAPDGAASLLKTLDDFDRKLRDMKLPKAKTDELSNKVREQLIKNHILLRDMECPAGVGASINRVPNEEELSIQRRIIRQNDQIIEELQRRR